MSLLHRALAGILIAVAAAHAAPAAAENVLRWANMSEVYGFDPHSATNAPTQSLVKQTYEALVELDANLAISPQLALAWKPLEPTVWEFKLRQGVRFHDGTPFTAEDVVFSLERARMETSDLKPDLQTIAAVEALDDHTVRVVTSVPDPVLWFNISYVGIMSKAWAEKHEVTAPADHDVLQQTYAIDHANGTGPFILERFERDGRTELVRNPGWWGTQRYPHNIDRLVRIQLDDLPTGVEGLLAGQMDFLDTQPLGVLQKLQQSPEVKLVKTQGEVVFFLGMDQGSDELRSSDVRGKNPFRDKRVRQALYHAVDVRQITDEVMGGLALPAGMLVVPGVNGYQPELAERLAHDPDRARTLLAEAGYPEGFSVTLDCPEDWSSLGGKATCSVLTEQFKAVGVDVSVDFQPSGKHFAKTDNRRSDFNMNGWGETFDSYGTLNRWLHSRGRFNPTGYANPKVDELIDRIRGEMVTYARDAMLEQAWRIVGEDIVYIPVMSLLIVRAMREDLDLPVDRSYIPRFRLARFR